LRAGWTTEGIEWDEAAASLARSYSGAHVYVCDLFAGEIPKLRYSLVTLTHVLEHFAQPARVLARVSTLLAPSGRLYLEYPNPQALGLRIFQHNWSPLEAPRHLVLPSIAALRAALEAAGLTAKRVYSSSRTAAWFIAGSQAYKRGRPLSDAKLTRRARALSLLESFLLALGVPCGEEVIAIAEKR
jgi:2-polyprenyl-3-methyl-5-hydroxy-6-metoxy-1,4-benzoquinol methylase